MKMMLGQWAAWWRAQWRGTLGVALASAVLLAPLPASAQFCPGCIQNSAVPQNGTFNLTQGATIQGVLTVGTLSLTNMAVSGTLTAGQLVGGGSGITALNASALASGTVASARVAGAYSGITGVGIVTAGTWRGSKVLPAWGGTGADLSLVSAGAVPYFVAGGTLAALASPSGVRVLQTAGSGAAPVWTNAPTLVGTNFSAIPLTALSNGTLQAGIQVPNASIVAVDAAKVSGNISGGAAFLTIALPVANLAAGTLPTTNAASSVTVSGVPPGTYGGPTTLAQFRVGTDGRLYDAKQFNLVAYSTQIAPGTLPPGVLLPAGQVSSGTLRNDVVASSVAASGVAAGTYGGPAKALTAAVQIDGRLTSLTSQDIALPVTQINDGTLPAGVRLPAASVNAGTLGSSVLAQNLTPNGVGAGVYGSPTISAQLTIDAQGRVTNATQFAIPGISTSAAWVDRFNDWHYPQTSRSSWTFTNNIQAIDVTATFGFYGPGQNILHLTPANVDTGYLSATVIASSVNVRAVGDPQLTTTGVTAGTKGTAARIPTVVVDAQGRITALTDQIVAVTTGQVSGIVQTNQGGTGNDWSATAAGGLPYFSGTGALSVLAKSINGYTLTLSGGVPVWSQASSSAINLSGGAANSVPYQSAANTTAMLAAGSGVLQEVASGAPAWTTIPTLTGTNFSGIPLAALNTGGLPTGITITTGNFTGGFNSASQLVQLTAGGILPALSGANLTALTAANISAGTLGPLVIASSVAATGVAAASYGSASAVPTFTVGVDGRLTAAANTSIAIAASQITSGQIAIAQGGTNLSGAGGTANRVLRTSDGSTFAMGQIIGPDIAAGTVPASALNQSGAASTNVLAWNGSQWAPSAAAAGTVTTTAGAAAGSTARFTGATSISSGAFTDNGTTVTAPSGTGFILNGTSNVETFLSSQTFSAAASFTVGVTVLSSSTVHCVVNAIQNTSNGYPQITFNSDTTSGHYSYVGVGESIGGAINSGANSSANIPPLNLVQVPTVGSHYSFSVEYNTTFTDETQIYGGGMQLNGNWATNAYSGRWTSGPPTTMTVTPSGGTVTGYIKCTKVAW